MLHNSLVSSKRGQDVVKKPHRRPVAPNTVNSSVRTREYLTTAEIERLMAAARKSSRDGHRGAAMILIGYRHGLRASECCALRRPQREQGLSSHVFMNERDGPMTPKAFHALFGRIGSWAKMQFPINTQTL